MLLAAVLVPVGGVGAQAGPTKVLGPGGGDTDPVAAPGFGRVTLTWSAPTGDGGSPIVGYEYTYSSGPSGSETDKGVWYPIPGSTGSTTSYTVTGLRNGESHTFKLRAVNAAGQKGTSSDDANSVTPTALPQAPGGLRAEPADSKITLSWTQRNSSSGQTAATGWTNLVRYEYQQKTGDEDWSSWNIVPDSDKNTQQFEITGLTNGVTYRFKLRAVNANGAGPATETKPVVASGKPGRPQNVRAVPGDESVTLSWSPSSDGGSPIIGWEYRGADAGGSIEATPWTRIPGSSVGTTSYVVTGLDNTKDYRFQVRAVNINGAGTASSSTALVGPGSVPGAIPAGAPDPQNTWFRQEPGEDSITLKWTEPRGDSSGLGGAIDDGGSPLVRYEYQQKTGEGEWSQWMTIPADRTFLSTGGTSEESSTDLAKVDSTGSRAYEVTGLTAGTPYRFRIRAVNRIGPGPYAESTKDIYPGTVPSAPSSLFAETSYLPLRGGGRVLLSWASGSDGGSSITKWEYKRADSVADLASASWVNLCDNTKGEQPGCASLSSVHLSRFRLVEPNENRPAINYPDGGDHFLIQDHYFMLRAVNGLGDGFPSSVVRASWAEQYPPGPPLGLIVTEYLDDPVSGGTPKTLPFIGFDSLNTADFPTPYSEWGEYSWKIGDGPWGPWTTDPAITGGSWVSCTSPHTFDEIDFKVGETYQVRYRHRNAQGGGPATESLPFVYGGPLLPGGGSTCNTGYVPHLRAVPGTSKVTISLRTSSLDDAGFATSATSNLTGTIRWEYSYKIDDGDWGEWMFVNYGEQFNNNSELEIDGLGNGVVHRFRIRAVLGSLPGVALESSPVTPGVAPPAPAGLGAQGGDRQATLTWTSTGTGGPAITKWQYCDLSTGCDAADEWTDVPGSQTTTTSVVVPGLTNYNDYTFRIRAENTFSRYYQPEGRRDPAITRWQYCDLSTGCDAEGEWTDVPRSNTTTTSVVVRSLTNGTAYTFRVRAVNAIGDGAAAQTLPVTPGRVPSAPVRALVEAGDAQVTFRVTKPSLPALSDDSVTVRGDRVTGYQVRKKRAGEPWEAWETLGTTVPKTANFKTDRPSAETSAVARNLENGVSYTFQVRAVNAYGPGPHVETSTVVPIGAPTPGTLSARAGDTQVVLSWAGSASGGSTITAWQYRQRQGDGGYGSWADIENSGPATVSHTVTGLSNGIGYRFAVRAVTANDQVKGFEFESDTVVPSTTPPQPAEVTASRGDRQVMLSWTAGTPGEPGEASWASPTTGWQYRMRTGDGGFATWTDVADSGAATSGHTVTGLINGVSYTFEVRAVNAMGAGAAASASATPAVVPSAPTLAAEPGDMAVTLSWSSNGDGGSAITGWQSRTGDGEWADLAASDANTVVVPNLDNGTAYIFGVRAVNAVGAGEAVTASATPAGTPPAPAVTAEAGDMMVMLSWTSNGDNGSAITAWQVRTGDGEWADLATDTTSHVVSDLVNGTAYTFGVRATNAMGDGEITTESATPAAVPSAPEVSVVGSDGEITLSWASAGDGGSRITGWHYRMRVGVGDYGEWIMMAADADSVSLTGLDTGTGAVTYVFEVRATNAIGDGAVATSDPVVPTSAPPVGDDYYSGVVDGPDFCADRSLGGARLFALDGDGDGVADTCSLPYTRREAIARQNAVVTLANRYPDQYRALVNAACAEDDGDQPCGGDTLAAPGYAPINDGGPYYSGIITGPGYCANRSLGGPTTYPLDSDGDGVADVCSLPYSRREAIARQKAGDALAAMHLDEFKTALTEECRRLGGTDYGDAPADLAADVCAR